MSEDKHLQIADGPRVLAEATVTGPDADGESNAQVTVSPGQLPAGTRRAMADAVSDTVSDDDAQRLTAAVPRGDAELIDGLSHHLDHVELRAAGSTSLVHGDVVGRPEQETPSRDDDPNPAG